MPSTTRPSRWFHVRLFPLLALVFIGLSSSCQSSRPRFSFQLAPHRMIPVAALPPVVEDSTAATAAPVANGNKAVVRKHSGVQTQIQTRSALVEAAVTVIVVQPPKVRPGTMHRRAFLGRPRATAEVGLGTTVLGVLGLVVLPVALIGLALSGGGLVWAIVAGAAALAVLVAYLDPFGR